MARARAAQLAAVRAIALGVLVASGCGRSGTAPDFLVRGVGVVVRSDAPFVSQPDLARRTESTVEAALAYWGGSWERLDGMTITLEGTRHVDCGGLAGATGCYDGDIRVSTSDMGEAVACLEQTALVHELGHAVIGDGGHTDPRWMDFEPVAAALEGRPGYDGVGPTECRLAVCLWRHPPSQP